MTVSEQDKVSVRCPVLNCGFRIIFSKDSAHVRDNLQKAKQFKLHFIKEHSMDAVCEALFMAVAEELHRERVDAVETLKDYLLSREYDIAIDFEDFGGLQEVFAYFIGRKPKEEQKNGKV